MKNIIPSKGKQIEALINHLAYDFTLKYAGRDLSGSPLYSKVFNVTKNEVKEYLKKRYNLNNLPFSYTVPGTKDGIYIIHKQEGYLVYYQERGFREPELLEPEEGAWNYYVDFTLRTSGTGLKWN
jgi:hypothetical protein